MPDTETITVDLSVLTIGDLAMFDKMKSQSMSQTELVAFLDRIVVGGASRLPLTRLKEVMAALQTSLVTFSNPIDGQGKA